MKLDLTEEVVGAQTVAYEERRPKLAQLRVSGMRAGHAGLPTSSEAVESDSEESTEYAASKEGGAWKSISFDSKFLRKKRAVLQPYHKH